MQIAQDTEAAIFKRLAYKSAYETGIEFGFDQTHKDAKAIRNAVTYIFNKVKDNPERYGLSKEVVALVSEGVAHRQVATTRNELTVVEREIESGDIKNLVTGVRDKTWRLIDRKLQRASKSNKRLDDIGLRELGTLAGIAFDKAQIISGQATEHVALMGKIDGSINPQDALDLVLKMREATVASKQK